MIVVVLRMHSKKMNSLIIGIETIYKGVFLSVPGQSSLSVEKMIKSALPSYSCSLCFS